ncbi:phage virion morphogenesis protein [Reyranella sp.]|uniref:phage virion morphogenesis protein n=1 Tax=Reyranella sp. TaxID=1929291 RepID=UPI002730F1A3|nr:phage virion morphogenesis protein [Reyranella sp.]MDP2373166.1 phage virion morphogenesis protein [Reyranella sp.]
MGLSMRLTIQGDQAIERRLGRLADRLGDLTPLMSILASFLRASTRQRFEDGEGPDGARWTPSIRARLTGGKTLVQHGILRDSINDQHGRNHAVVGTNDPRARMLHFGGVITARAGGALVFNLPGAGWRRVASVTIPPRPFVGLSTADGVEIGGLIDDYIARSVA